MKTTKRRSDASFVYAKVARRSSVLFLLVLLFLFIAAPFTLAQVDSDSSKKTSSTDEAKSFRFVVLPDMHINCSQDSITPTHTAAIAAIKKTGAKFVISTGNLIDIRKSDASNNPKCIETMWSNAKSGVIDPLKELGPFFFTPGKQDGLLYFGKDAEKQYEDFWNSFSNKNIEIDGTYGSYYSFDFENWHFVALQAPGSPSLYTAPKHRAWLEEDLKNAKADSKNIITFANSPFVAPAFKTTTISVPAKLMLKNDAELMALLNTYDVQAHFAGYSHMYGESVTGGIPEILSGFLGGFTPTKEGGDVSELGFLVVDVSGDVFQVHFVKAPDFSLADVPLPPVVKSPDSSPVIPDSLEGLGVCPPGYTVAESVEGIVALNSPPGTSSSASSSDVLEAAKRYEGRPVGTSAGEFTDSVFVEQILKDVGITVSDKMHKQILMSSTGKTPQELATTDSPEQAGVQYAIIQSGKGSEVRVPSAEPGDFIQYWTNDGGIWKTRAGIISKVNSVGIFDIYGALPEKQIVTTTQGVDLSASGESKVFIARLSGSAISAKLDDGQTNSEVVAGCGKIVAAIGDSITVGSYVAELRTLCKDSKIKNSDGAQDSSQQTVAKQKEEGKRGDYLSYNGKFTKNMVADFEKAIATDSFDTVIILGGTNDIVGGGSPSVESVKNNLKSMYDAAHAKGLRVVALTVPPAGGNDKMNSAKQAVLEEVNTWIMSEAPVDIRVNAYAALEDPDNPGAQREGMVDGMHIHPIGEGKKRLATTVYEALVNAPPSTFSQSESSADVGSSDIPKVSCVPDSILPQTIYDFVINSKDSLSTILGIARQNLAVGIDKSIQPLSDSALCIKFVADREYDVSQLKSIFGNSRLEVESQLQSVTFLRKQIRVHRLIAPVFSCVERQILNCEEGNDYDFRTISSYSWQSPVSNPDMLATSSFGISLNINMDSNLNTLDGSLEYDIPECVITAFKDFGFRWGGDFEMKKVPSLFFFSANPERIAISQSGVPTQEAGVGSLSQSPSCSSTGKNVVKGITVNTPYGSVTLNPTPDCEPPCESVDMRDDYVASLGNEKELFVVHTTAGGDRTIQTFQSGDRGPNIGTQYVISRDGTTHQLASDDAIVYHAKGYNKIGIGVEVMNSEDLCRKVCPLKRLTFCSEEDCQPRPQFPTNPTESDAFQKRMFGKVAEVLPVEQKRSLLKLAAEKMILYGMSPDGLVRHVDSSTQRGEGHKDPGPQIEWYEFKENVIAAINSYNAQAGNCQEHGSSLPPGSIDETLDNIPVAG